MTMKKIMFNDKYGLTKAVLDGRKTQTRRITGTPPYKNYDIAFPVFEEEDWYTNPLYGSFCWVNKDNPEEHTDWIKPRFKESEVVAVAQSYGSIVDELENDNNATCAAHYEKNIGKSAEYISWMEHPGFNNKMFVTPEKMIHQIRITSVRIQRLQDISDEDCSKEGIIKKWHAPACKDYYYVPGIEVKSVEDVHDTPQEAFSQLIDKVSGKGTWDANPYVWVYDFELVK